MNRFLRIFSFLCVFLFSCATVGPPAKIEFIPGVIRDGQMSTMGGGVKIQFASGGYKLVSVPVGTQMRVSAHVYDASGKQLDIEPTWSASDPEVLLITPTHGTVVTIKGLKSGTTDITISAGSATTKVAALRIE